MTKDIDKWVSQCVQCQQSALTIKQETKPIPTEVSQPFELVGMDLMGKLNKDICKMLDIERSLCAPYHPQTNGLVEKLKGTIQRALCKLVSERPNTWDTYCDVWTQNQKTIHNKVFTIFPPLWNRGSSAISPIPNRFSAKAGDLASTPQPAGDPASTLQGVEAATDPAVSPFSGSTKVEQDVRKAWDGMTAAVLLSKIGPYKLFYFDIFRTSPGRELESELINAYMKFLERTYNTSSAEKVLCIDSFGRSAVWQKKIPLFKWDPTDYSTLYGIVNDNHHWFVIIIFPKQRKSLLLDSLGESSQKLKRCQEIS
ncbi:hypothetical protein CHARACLAT_030082, partial [Characodon lateralis]|nr:hypothetical protein [Characodon lateralis]